MKYVSRKGTTINIPKGLSDKQIARIKADADAGYGTRAQETADKLAKKVSKNPKAPVDDVPTDQPIFNPDTGMIDDPNNVLKQIPNFDAFKDEVEKAAAAREAYLTRDYDEQEAKRTEATKQELAQRGIPYSVERGNLYGDSVGAITDQFQNQRTDARNLAYGDALDTGLSAYGTNVDAFLKATLGLNDQELTKYGIDKDFLAKMKAIKAQKQIANKPSGGGGGGGGGQPSGGFEIIG